MSSQDLFYLVLSLCILWFSVFLCWLIYQAGRFIRNANKIVENVTDKLELITDAVHLIRQRVEGLSSSMGLISTMVGGLVEKFVTNRLSKELDKRNKKKKKEI